MSLIFDQPASLFSSYYMMSLPQTEKSSDPSVGTRAKRFFYKPEHLISLMRQVAADNPYQYDSAAEQVKAWEDIATQLEQVGISAQWKSSQLKCHKLLDDYDKELKQPLKSGTEPKLCEEMNQLL